MGYKEAPIKRWRELMANTTAIIGKTETSAPHISTAANWEAPANTVALIRTAWRGSRPFWVAANPKAAPNATTNNEMGSSRKNSTRTLAGWS